MTNADEFRNVRIRQPLSSSIFFMAAAPDHAHRPATVVFDGVCVFCSGWVRFLLKRDREGPRGPYRFRFAAMQSEAGRALLTRHGIDPDDPISFLLVDETGAFTDSTAVLRIVTRLGGLWRFAGAFYAVPRPLRDGIYRFVARRRYRWFGKRASCFVPTPETAHRFL
jgi:predicted DCC family thiol-disulfide oxidoreductase YuxK